MSRLEIMVIGFLFVLLPYLTFTTAVYLLYKEIHQEKFFFKERSFVSVEATIIKCGVIESSNGSDNTKRFGGPRGVTPYHPFIKVGYSFQGKNFEVILKKILGKGGFNFSEAYAILEEYAPGQSIEVKDYLTNKIGASDLQFFSGLNLNSAIKSKFEIRIDPMKPWVTEYDLSRESYWISSIVLLLLSFPIFILYLNADKFHYSPNKILLISYPIFLLICFSTNNWSKNSPLFADGSNEKFKPKYSFTVDEHFDPKKLTGIKIIQNK